MRTPALVLAAFAALAVFVFAPSAMADGFYVTFATSSGSSTGRVAGAVFDSSNARSAHVEIDDWTDVTELFSDCVAGKTMTVTVEFIDASGKVYMTNKFGDARLANWRVTFAPGSSPALVEALDFAYARSETQTSSGASQQRAPTIARQVARTTVSSIGDAYMQVPSFPDDSTQRRGWSRVAGFTMSVQAPLGSSTGQSAGKTQFSAVTITKNMGADTASFQAAQARGQVLSGVDVVFTKETPQGLRQDVLTVKLSQVRVTTDAIQATSSAQTETLTLSPTKITLVGRTPSSSPTGAPQAGWDVAMQRAE